MLLYLRMWYIDEWLSETPPQLLMDYAPEDVFNADETVLFERLLPNKTFSFEGDQCHAGKKLKERISLLVCANVVVLKSFHSLQLEHLPSPNALKV